MVEFKIIKLTNDIEFGSNSRLAILGKTGVGKSTFSKKKILPQYERYVVWDPKIELDDVKHDILINNPTDFKKSIDKYDYILYQPKDISSKDFDRICKVIFESESENNCLYIDEVMEISSVNKIEYYHKMLMTQGRSKGIGIINVSQRPSDIHNSILSESTDFFCFKLTLDPDINKVEKIIGTAAEEILYLPYFTFLYANEADVRKLYDTDLKPYKPSLKDYIAKIRV